MWQEVGPLVLTVGFTKLTPIPHHVDSDCLGAAKYIIYYEA